MEIQQQHGVVVEVAESLQGFAKRKRGGRGVTGERKAPGTQVRLPSLPSTIYRGLGGAPAPCRSHLGRGAAALGVAWPPSQVEAPHPLGFLTLGAWEAQGGAHQPTRGWFPRPLSLWGPPG